MESTARLYLCARCRRQVVICSYCDRGQRYCGRGCARARVERVVAAFRRPDRSFIMPLTRGKLALYDFGKIYD